jgi:AraC-like DNA-binding protein
MVHDLDRSWFKAAADAFQAVELTGGPAETIHAVLQARQVRPPGTAFEAVFARGLWADLRLRRLALPESVTGGPKRPRLVLSVVSRRAAQAVRNLALTPGLRRATVARSLSMGESRLARLLTPTGLTFWDHVHATRTDEAARLLIETDLSIKEITGAVGYATGGLDRPFVKRFGTAPRGWRDERRLTAHTIARVR